MRQLDDNKEAVIAIQGGGLYGLTLLGQLQAVLEDEKYSPLAFAGTSAGAIVATLSWAGYTPAEIRDEFVKMAARNELTALLNPPGLQGFDLSQLARLKDKLKTVLNKIEAPKPSGRLAKLRAKLGATLSAPARYWSMRGLVNEILPHLRNRGFFTGEALEARIEQLVRSKIKPPAAMVPPGEPLRFRHVAEMLRKQHEYHPPLLLTATNLSRGRLEIFSSIDSAYGNVPIAKAVRASAGFPIFFKPKDIPEAPEGGWFVDGGVVANFPIWAFSEAFRSDIRRSELFDFYGHIANKPWIRIGLRVVDDIGRVPDLSEAARFFPSLLSMLTGGSRNQLEEVLTASARRSIVIKQPYSETGLDPEHFLNVDALSETGVRNLVAKGRAFARTELKRISAPAILRQPQPNDMTVEDQLAELVRTCELVFQRPVGELKLRANLFMPVATESGDRMRLVAAHNMAGDADWDMEFPDLQSGVTGFCYSGRRPMLCNLEAVDQLRKGNPNRYRALFGMPPTLQGKVREDRTWLASVPIFDPYEVHFDARGGNRRIDTKYEGYKYFGIDTEIDGPVLGVLNIDAGWDYTRIALDPDTNKHFSDPRVKSVLGIMQAASFSIARALTQPFGTPQ